MNEPVLVINADELLERLKEMEGTAVQEGGDTEIDAFREQYWGYELAMKDVIKLVEYKAFFMGKERERND